MTSRKRKKISLESVQFLSTIDCCVNSCCQRTKCDNVKALCKEFWSQSLQKITSYVYGTLQVACCDLPCGNLFYVFSLNGEEVCCKAWYEMHSI